MITKRFSGNIRAALLVISAIICFIGCSIAPYGAAAQTADEMKAAFERGDLGLTEDIAKQLLKIDENDHVAEYYIGRVYQSKGQLDRAVRKYRDVIEMNPTFEDVYFTIGKMYLEWPRMTISDRWRYARLYYKKAIENVPESGDALMQLFETYVRTGEAKRGAKVVTEFMENNEDNASGYLAYAELIKASEFNTLKRCDLLYDYYVKAVQKEPPAGEDYFRIGWGFFTCGDLDAAYAAYRTGFRRTKDPEYRRYFEVMVITNALRIYPTALAYFLKGYALMPPEEQALFTNPEEVPPILKDQLEKEYSVSVEEFLAPEWDGSDPEIVLRKLRHYAIVWLREVTGIERKRGLEISGRETFEIPYLVHWGKFNYIDYAFHFLLEEDERAYFLLLTIPEQRENYREKYFIRKDPTPNNDVSEIRDQFYERLEFVYENFKIFPNSKRPYQYVQDFSGFDDCGRVYIKYGQPFQSYFDSGGTKRLANTTERQEAGLPALLVNDGEIGFQNNISEGGRAGAPVFIKPNMTWSYSNIDARLFFDFVKIEEGYFTLVDNLDEAGLANNIAWLLYMDRAYYGNMSGIFEYYLQQYDTGMIENTNPGVFYSEYLIPDLQKKDDVVANYPTNLIDAVVKKDPLVTFIDAATFKGEDNRTRLEIYTAVEYSKLKFVSDPAGGDEITTLAYDVLIKDQDVTPVVRDTLSMTVRSAGGSSGMTTMNQFRFDLPPGYHHLDVVSENPEGGRQGTFKLDRMIPEYSGTDLQISDIQFAAEITPAAEAGPFVKNGLNIVPYPFRQVMKDTPVGVYLEIYNLTKNAAGSARFSITYEANVKNPNLGMLDLMKSAFTGEENQTTTSVSFTRNVQETDSPEYLMFDFSKLMPGLIELTVRITDDESKKTVSKSVEFHLLR